MFLVAYLCAAFEYLPSNVIIRFPPNTLFPTMIHFIQSFHLWSLPSFLILGSLLSQHTLNTFSVPLSLNGHCKYGLRKTSSSLQERIGQVCKFNITIKLFFYCNTAYWIVSLNRILGSNLLTFYANVATIYVDT